MKAPTGTRFKGIVVARGSAATSLARDVAQGLRSLPVPTLPARLLYDDAGSALFDRICETPEYYPTRTELALLEQVAPDIARRTGSTELVELGSGLARKTHVLLAALGVNSQTLRWVPFDIDAATIREAGERLLSQYERLSVRGVVGDFSHDLQAIPAGQGRLVAFLGGTIGNFDPEEAARFVTRLRALLGPGDHFLLAADLVKDRPTLHAAYNDAGGLTAAFNLNVLTRLVREFDARLAPAHFRHDAFFAEATSQIEMHARAIRPTRVVIPRLGVDLRLAAGESIRTEISRKFTPQSLRNLLDSAGFEIVELYVAPTPYALVLAKAKADRQS